MMLLLSTSHYEDVWLLTGERRIQLLQQPLPLHRRDLTAQPQGAVSVKLNVGKERMRRVTGRNMFRAGARLHPGLPSSIF